MISKQNINVDEKWTPKDTEYFMCNFYAKPNTILSNVKGVTFNKCVFHDCKVNDSNQLNRCNVYDSTVEAVVELTVEQRRITQLEKYITDNNLVLPVLPELQEVK